LPLTSALTNLPSNSATYRLIIVLSTKKTLCPIKSLNSLLFQPGMHIFSSLSRFLKNSLFSSTFFLPVASPSPAVVLSADLEARRKEAAFCSAMAFRIRFMRATKRVRYTARDMRVRCWRYRRVRSLTMALADALVRRWEERGFEKTAMATVDEALVLCKRLTPCAKRRGVVVLDGRSQ
jgi:hypothetical protein